MSPGAPSPVRPLLLLRAQAVQVALLWLIACVPIAAASFGAIDLSMGMLASGAWAIAAAIAQLGLRDDSASLTIELPGPAPFLNHRARRH